MSKAAFVYDHQVSSHVLRGDHVMRPARLRYTYELLDAYGVFGRESAALVSPRLATVEELLTFHTREYVEAVEGLSKGPDESGRRYNPAQFGFSQHGDNPVYSGMYEAALLSTGASLLAADLVLTGRAEVAFNVAGGLHHAMPDHASGFCIFNDPAIAIRALMARGLRVAYVDIDAHHGDGVQHAGRRGRHPHFAEPQHGSQQGGEHFEGAHRERAQTSRFVGHVDVSLAEPRAFGL